MFFLFSRKYNSFLQEWIWAWPRFESEKFQNSEIAYSKDGNDATLDCYY